MQSPTIDSFGAAAWRFTASFAPVFAQVVPRRQRAAVLLGAGAALALLALYWLERRWPSPQGLPALLAALLLGVALFAWHGAFLRSAVRQNQPAYACLVPHLRRRLMIAVVSAHLACCLLLAAALSVSLGHFGYLLSVVSVIFSLLMFAQRYRWATFMGVELTLFLLVLQGVLLHYVLAALRLADEFAVTLAALSIAAALLAWAVRSLLPRGGDRHWDWQQRLGRQSAERRDGAAVGGWRTLWRHGYFQALRRDSGAVAGRVPSPARMMLHALGITAHEGSYMALSLGATVLAGLLLALGPDRAQLFDLDAGAHLLQLAILLPPQLYVISVPSALAARRGEHGLYRLTPRAPAAAAINRVLAAGLLARFARIWLVAVLCVTVLNAIVARAPVNDHFSLLLSVLVLPFAWALVRDYAAIKPMASDARMLIGTLTIIALYLAALGASRRYPGLDWVTLALAIVLPTLLILGLRWRVMMEASAALPAAHLAP